MAWCPRLVTAARTGGKEVTGKCLGDDYFEHSINRWAMAPGMLFTNPQ